MKTIDCLADQDLMPFASDDSGEQIDPTALRHVNNCPDCRQRLASLKRELQTIRAVLKNRVPSPAPKPARPARIGGFVVIGLLDEGGQGSVYRAVDSLDRDVVIKIGHRAADQPGVQDLLVTEGKVLAQLEHPNIASVYGLGLHEGKPFLVMRYVRGRTLEQEGADHCLRPYRAAEIMAVIARAVAAAHHLDIVHQDIKPRNILIDESGKPYLIDFGMARLHNAWSDEPGSSGPLGGTASFISPEQANRQANQVGPATDVFALGGTLYYLLTGQAPFQAADHNAMIDRARRCDFDRDALAKAGAPAGLRRICLRALSAEPAKRYHSAEDMAAALERFALRPVQLRKFLAVAAALALVIGGSAIGYRFAHPDIPIDHSQTQPLIPPAKQEPITIIRANTPIPLARALPIHMDDQVELEYKLPKTWKYLLYSLRTNGQVAALAPQVVDAEPGFEKLVYPGNGNASQLDQQGGTELIFACASPDDIDPIAVRSVLEGLGRLPKLPIDVILKMDLDNVATLRGFSDDSQLGGSRLNLLTDVQFRLDQARLKLRDQKIPWISAAAFSH